MTNTTGDGGPGWVPQRYAPPEHPQATTAMVLGILGLVTCTVLSPFAWRIGKRAVSEIDASRGQLGGRGSAQAGYVMGLIGTIMLGIVVGGLVLVVVVWIVIVSLAMGHGS
jgi:hypothetical protein